MLANNNQEESPFSYNNVGYSSKISSEQNQLINQAASNNGIPASILYGVFGAESSFGKQLQSSAGAMGPFHFMPNTAKQYGIDPYNFEQSANAAAKFLASNYKKSGNWESAIAGYNAGPGRMNN